jgi:peptidoglycan-associated lipoprotein
MKITKLVHPLAIAMAVALVGTGCRHQAVPITKIPGSTAPAISDQGINTIPMAPPSTGVTGTGIATASAEQFEGMNEDRATLAAYTVHFAFDSAVIRSSEQANLQSVASALSATPADKLLIEGNCDERGTEEYNRALGERRALAAREALSKLGVDPMRIRTESFGKDKPLDPGHDDSAWSKNRRDDFVLLLPNVGT